MTNDEESAPKVRSNKNIRIKVFGVGGAGGNAVNNMIANHVKSAHFYVANTDAQDLGASNAKHKILLGQKLTHGLGAGAKYQVGEKAAEESRSQISKALDNTDMAVITAGMGGGTGTGAAPVIAKIAHSKGILTIAVVTKPFVWEGRKRAVNAHQGLEALKKNKNVDTLICIDNQRLSKILPRKTSLPQAFATADNVLRDAVVAITSLITQQSYINLDFADVTTVMKNQGSGLIGIGTASGKDRATAATKRAIKSPLLTANIDTAKQVLLNVSGGPDMSLFEAQNASKTIADHTSSDVNIIFGTSIDKSLGNSMRVTVIATGINDKKLDEIPDFKKRTFNNINNANDSVQHPHYSRIARLNNEKRADSDSNDSAQNTNSEPRKHVLPKFNIKRTDDSTKKEPEKDASAEKDQHGMPSYFNRDKKDGAGVTSKQFTKRAEARLSRRFKNSPFFNRSRR